MSVEKFVVGEIYNHTGHDPYYGPGFKCLFVTEDGWALLRGAEGWPPKLVLATDDWELGSESDYGVRPLRVGSQMDYMDR